MGARCHSLSDEPVKVVLNNPNAKMPTRAYPGDAGYDLYYSGERDLLMRPGAVIYIPCHVAMQWPEGIWGFIIGRSSAFQRGILVNPTVIDAGWRGELFAYVRNVINQWITIEPGDRVAQIVPMPLLAEGRELIQVDELDPSERGVNGFGSSGR